MEDNNNFEDKAKKMVSDVKDESSSFDKKDVESGKVMGILSYLGILALVPYLTEKNNKFVIYHAKQGLNLFIIEIIGSAIISIAGSFLFVLSFIVSLISSAFALGIFVLSILGIVDVCNGKAKELPVINKFKIIK